MVGKTKHLSKTDLRRGLFTKAVVPSAPAPEPLAKPSPARSALPAATSADEQDLLFDLTAFDAAPKTRVNNGK